MNKVKMSQIPSEPAQYNGWTGAELLVLVDKLEFEIKRLKESLKHFHCNDKEWEDLQDSANKDAQEMKNLRAELQQRTPE